MKRIFTLDDIQGIKDVYDSASLNHDELPVLLKAYKWDDIYETEDGSLIFAAGDKNQIEIEFFDFKHPLKRTCSILYRENGEPKILHLDHRKKAFA